MSSENERIAPSFVRTLLGGYVDLSSLTPFPQLSQGTAEQLSALVSSLKQCNQSDAADVSERLREWGLLGDAPLFSTGLWSRVIRQLGMIDVSAALCATVHSALGVRLLQNWGREDQLREVQAHPRGLCAFSLTEDSPGSDVSRLMTYAEPVADGFVLNGAKNWVTNAASASHFIVFARTAPLIAADKPKITAFLVPRGPGIFVEPAPTGVLPRSGVAQLRFDHVRLSKAQILGSEGKGFRVIMSGLSEARLFVSAAILGSCIEAFNSVVARLQNRRAFGRSIGKFPSVQFGIAAMLSDLLAMESLVHAVSGTCDSGARVDPVERGVVRLYVSRASQRVLETARELYGAAAFKGEASISQRWADTRALSLLDGSDSALESYIVLEGTREIRHLLSRLTDSSDPFAKVDAAASLVMEKIGMRLKRVGTVDVPGLRSRELHALTAQLHQIVDQMLRKYGHDIVEKQHLHRRAAMIIAELSAWLAVQARVSSEIERAGEVGARRMIDIAAIWVASAHTRITHNLSALTVNDDKLRDEVAVRAYGDKGYPFDVL